MRSVANAVEQLARERAAEFDVLLHPNAHVSSTLRDLLGRCPGVRLVDACGHAELIRRVRSADLVLSDSGGIQEETPALGVPLFVLRDKTERPEGIATGNTRLVGTDAGAIVDAVRAFLVDTEIRTAMATPAFPFGDGTASPQIAAVIARWIADRETRAIQSLRQQAGWRR
jgi:UDP-N-acetylglucosamine 2-epimerase (non-hydrolysing)